MPPQRHTYTHPPRRRPRTEELDGGEATTAGQWWPSPGQGGRMTGACGSVFSSLVSTSWVSSAMVVTESVPRLNNPTDQREARSLGIQPRHSHVDMTSDAERSRSRSLLYSPSRIKISLPIRATAASRFRRASSGHGPDEAHRCHTAEENNGRIRLVTPRHAGGRLSPRRWRADVPGLLRQAIGSVTYELSSGRSGVSHHRPPHSDTTGASSRMSATGMSGRQHLVALP